MCGWGLVSRGQSGKCLEFSREDRNDLGGWMGVRAELNEKTSVASSTWLL